MMHTMGGENRPFSSAPWKGRRSILCRTFRYVHFPLTFSIIHNNELLWRADDDGSFYTLLINPSFIIYIGPPLPPDWITREHQEGTFEWCRVTLERFYSRQHAWLVLMMMKQYLHDEDRAVGSGAPVVRHLAITECWYFLHNMDRSDYQLSLSLLSPFTQK